MVSKLSMSARKECQAVWMARAVPHGSRARCSWRLIAKVISTLATAGLGATVRKISRGGVVTTLAGSPTERGSADGTGSDARFGSADSVALDKVGNIYVADGNNDTIRMITTGNVVTTIAGLAGAPGSADGTGSAARFNWPHSVAVGRGGYVYVADAYNHTIRQVTTAGVVTTVAGLAGVVGSADGTGSAARLQYPSRFGHRSIQ